ncbi:DUF4365 domain-containing protein [Kribbella sp. VKM Ac-2568]|uniref:DUF4365 domain-containing protein n=1 Tax=Kribbella sp. VKM Ac-2568 TaxID=2512219 RepID=UPI00130516E5|nr:DUF4365 domain-containing protein [Kribbella sp. VKM Ac-2568]
MTTPDDADGPIVSDTWVTSQKAVNAFQNFCLDQRWVFTETPEQTDFGKDGYLDFSKDGRLTGQCIALQIKGGVSFRKRDGYIIPADRRRRTFWMESSVPVFGIVWDPVDSGLYWTELTEPLRQKGIDTTLRIPITNRLRVEALDDFLDAMWRSTTGPTIALAFGSDDAELQDAAAYDCFGLGRADARYLILLRRVMFGLRPTALDWAIKVLNYCSLNGDNSYRSEWMSENNRATVREQFTWTVDEAIELLDRTPDEEGFQRGTFSSCIYWLIVGTDFNRPRYVDLTEAATLRAASSGREHAAKWGLVLRVYWAGEDGLEVFKRLIEAEPVLGRSDVARLIGQTLNDHGYISL